MIHDDAYDRIADELPPPGHGAEVLVVVQLPDGTRTEAAVMHDAAVILEHATDVHHHGLGPTGYTPRVYGSALQIRVTGLTADIYDPRHFNQPRQIEGRDQ